MTSIENLVPIRCSNGKLEYLTPFAIRTIVNLTPARKDGETYVEDFANSLDIDRPAAHRILSNAGIPAKNGIITRN